VMKRSRVFLCGKKDGNPRPSKSHLSRGLRGRKGTCD